MLTVIVRGGCNDGKSTVAALVAKVLGDVNIPVNIVDEDDQAQRLLHDHTRLERNFYAMSAKAQVMQEAILVHTENTAHPARQNSPFGMVELTDRHTGKNVYLLRKAIQSIAPREGGHYTLVTSQCNQSYQHCEVSEEVAEVRDRMKACEWAEKVDVLAHHTVHAARVATGSR